MKVIPRLEELRAEIAELDGDLVALSTKRAKLEEDSARAESARDASLINRFRSGEPIRQTDIDGKAKDLQSQLDIVDATIAAMEKHKAVLLPELSELEQVEKEADGWREFGLAYISARVLSSQLNRKVKEAFDSARGHTIRTTWGENRIEKHIPACVGEYGRFAVGRLETEALKALGRIDPDRFPRPDRVDLTLQDAWPTHRRGSEYEDRRVIDEVGWQGFLVAEERFLREYGLVIGPTEQEIAAKIAQTLPSAPMPPYH